MHIFGKILVVLIVLTAPVALGFAAKAINVRNSWLEMLKEPEQGGGGGGSKWQSDENVKLLEQKRHEKRSLETDLANEMLGWDEFWDDQQAGPAGAADSFQLSVPQNLGNRIVDGQVVYLFKLNNDGPMFVGPFRNAQGSFDPTWTVDPDDAAIWQQQGLWRVRTMIPVSDKEYFSRLDVLGTRIEERRVAQEENLMIQDGLIEKATANRELRLKELINGNPELEAERDRLPPEMVDGYVAALEVARQERDDLADEVDQLRRELKKTHDRYEKLRKENLELIGP